MHLGTNNEIDDDQIVPPIGYHETVARMEALGLARDLMTMANERYKTIAATGIKIPTCWRYAAGMHLLDLIARLQCMAASCGMYDVDIEAAESFAFDAMDTIIEEQIIFLGDAPDRDDEWYDHAQVTLGISRLVVDCTDIKPLDGFDDFDAPPIPLVIRRSGEKMGRTIDYLGTLADHYRDPSSKREIVVYEVELA